MTGQGLEPQRAESQVFYGYVIVTASLFMMVMIWGTNYSFGIFFKPLLSEFGWTRAMTSGAFSLAILMEGFGSMLLGRLTDRFGARLIMTACGLFFGTGFLLMSKVYHIWHLYLFYGVIIGIGLSGSYVSLMSIIARWFVRRRGMIIAIVISGVSIGTLIMTPIANQLILAYGWRVSFVSLGVIALVSITGVSQLLRDAPNQTGQGQHETEEVKGEGPNLQSVPITLQAAIHTSQLWLLCCILLLWGFCKYVVLVHIAPHAIELGISATNAANVLAVIGGATFLTTIILGIAADRIGSERAFIIGLAIMSAALIWLLAAGDLWALYLFAAVFSFGYACGSVLMPTIVAEVFGFHSYGALLGVVNFSACIGCATGPVLAGYLFDITGDYTLAFLVTAALSVVSLILTLLLKTNKISREIHLRTINH